MTALSSATFAATPSAPDWRNLVSVAEAAKRLDMNPGHLARKCGDQLQAQGLAFYGKRPCSLGQPQWFVHTSFDPRLIAGPIADGHVEPDLSSYTQRQRTEALNRRAAVETWNTGRSSWNGSIKQIEARVLQALRDKFPDLKISRSAIYTWAKLYRRPADTVKLIDHRGGNRRGKSDAAAWEAFKDLFLHENAPSLHMCWSAVDRLAKENGWQWCGIKSCYAQLDERISPEQQSFHRQPEQWRTQLAPFIPQNSEAWGAGEVFVGDHKQIDLICMFGGQKIRPWLTTWLDWRTRKKVGWVLSDNPNSTTILGALRHALKDPSNFGGPRIVWIDNGKDYDSWLFHGVTKTERREKIKPAVDEQQAFGIFKALNIEAHFATPYNANGKARLERWFRTLESFCKTFETYTGDGIDTRPQRLNEILATPHRIPSFATVKQRIADHIAGDNARTDHDLDDLVENGVRLSPDQAFASWCATRRIAADPAALDLLLQFWHKPVSVTRKGVTIAVQGESLSYGMTDPALSAFKAIRREDRKSVLVSYDPHDLATVRVYDTDYRFVCTVAMNDVGGGASISADDIARMSRDKARYKKALKHQADAGITAILTNNEHAAHIAANRQAPPPAPSNDQPSMRIVQTPLDGQGKEIDREQVKMKMAVGSEDIDFPIDVFASLSRSQPRNLSERADADADADAEDAIDPYVKIGGSDAW